MVQNTNVVGLDTNSVPALYVDEAQKTNSDLTLKEAQITNSVPAFHGDEAQITNSVPALCVDEAQNTKATVMPPDEAQNNKDVHVDEARQPGSDLALGESNGSGRGTK